MREYKYPLTNIICMNDRLIGMCQSSLVCIKLDGHIIPSLTGMCLMWVVDTQEYHNKLVLKQFGDYICTAGNYIKLWSLDGDCKLILVPENMGLILSVEKIGCEPSYIFAASSSKISRWRRHNKTYVNDVDIDVDHITSMQLVFVNNKPYLYVCGPTASIYNEDLEVIHNDIALNGSIKDCVQFNDELYYAYIAKNDTTQYDITNYTISYIFNMTGVGGTPSEFELTYIHNELTTQEFYFKDLKPRGDYLFGLDFDDNVRVLIDGEWKPIITNVLVFEVYNGYIYTIPLINEARSPEVIREHEMKLLIS